MDTGVEAVADADLRAAFRRQARRVVWQAAASAALLAGLYIAATWP